MDKIRKEQDRITAERRKMRTSVSKAEALVEELSEELARPKVESEVGLTYSHSV